MVQILDPRRDIAGSIGKGFGQGLASELPKVVEHHNLSKGLQQFEQDSAGMTPIQQLTRLSSIRGITPQMVQSFGELAKQESQGNALSRMNSTKNENQDFHIQKQPQVEENTDRKGVTTTQGTEATRKPYIPKTYQEILARASQLFNANKGLYKNDSQNAIQAATQEDAQDQARNIALQNQRKNEQDIQTRVQQELSSQSEKAGVKIPDRAYSKIEDQALEDVRSGKRTEFEAGKHYKKELDDISRDYKAIDTLGTARIVTKSGKDNKDSLRSLRKKFAKRDELEHFADTMVAKNNLSPSKASYLAYPVSDIKELNNAIKDLPELEKYENLFKSDISPEVAEKGTLKQAPKLAEAMGQKGSPLAIGEELKSRGYDPQVWMNYLDKNRDKLKLAEWQGRELDKPRSFTNTVDDLWMFFFSGLDPLVEQ